MFGVREGESPSLILISPPNSALYPISHPTRGIESNIRVISGPLTPWPSIFAGNGLALQKNLEYGIYPEPSFSGFEAIKIILKFTEKTVGSGLLSLRFMPS